MQKKIIGSGKMGTESESSTQNLGILISQTFKNSISSAAERHFSLPPVCHFFGRPDICEVQLGSSSRAKHGGAYFSAVRGSIKDPIAV